MHRLKIPPEVEDNPNVAEIFRAWMFPNGDIGFATTGSLWRDPAAIGIFFADLARHYFETSGIPRREWGQAIRRVAEGMLAEAD